MRVSVVPSNEKSSIKAKAAKQVRRWYEHPLGLPLAMFIVLFLIATAVVGFFVWNESRNPTIKPSDNYIVIVKHDNISNTVPTNARRVGDVLRALNVPIGKYDRVEPALSAPITGDNFLINVYRSAPVKIIDGDKSVLVQSAAATPRGMVAFSTVELYPEDQVKSEMTNNFLLDQSLGGIAVVNRATPVNLVLYGKPITIRTQSKTVGDMLKERGIKLGKDDTVKPAAATKLESGMQISIVRDGIQVVTIDEEIPAPVRTIKDPSLSFGSEAVRQPGSPGKMTNTYEIVIKDGIEVSRKLLQSVRVVEPVERVVAKGNTSNIPSDKQAVMSAAGISPSDYAYVDYIFSRESHWNAAAASPNGYYGLGQTNLGRLSGACPNWQNDPVCQTRLFTQYANRYGGWEGAYNFWIGHNWW